MTRQITLIPAEPARGDHALHPRTARPQAAHPGAAWQAAAAQGGIDLVMPA